MLFFFVSWDKIGWAFLPAQSPASKAQCWKLTSVTSVVYPFHAFWKPSIFFCNISFFCMFSLTISLFLFFCLPLWLSASVQAQEADSAVYAGPAWPRPAQRQAKCLWQPTTQLLTVIRHHGAWATPRWGEGPPEGSALNTKTAFTLLSVSSALHRRAYTLPALANTYSHNLICTTCTLS